MATTQQQAGNIQLSSCRQPAESAPHQACWTAYPYDPEAWFDALPAAQREFRELCRAISQHGQERLDILVANAAVREQAERDLAGVPCQLHDIAYGDIWLRDTAPVFMRQAAGALTSVCFQFNGWGGKYVMPGDEQVASKIAATLDYPIVQIPLVLEGGSIDVDGEGTCLTTAQCLLNPNRNPGRSRAEIEALVAQAYGLEKILWLDEGLLNDHTDGHIDNIARFVAPGKVVCMEAQDSKDPNYATLKRIKEQLQSFSDAQGRRLEVIALPSVGTLLDDEGRVMPASYMNFYIANAAVLVPIYGTPNDAAALRVLERCFPGRKVIGLSARAILSGGGSFHCITQQQPLA